MTALNKNLKGITFGLMMSVGVHLPVSFTGSAQSASTACPPATEDTLNRYLGSHSLESFNFEEFFRSTGLRFSSPAGTVIPVNARTRRVFFGSSPVSSPTTNSMTCDLVVDSKYFGDSNRPTSLNISPGQWEIRIHNNRLMVERIGSPGEKTTLGELNCRVRYNVGNDLIGPIMETSPLEFESERPGVLERANRLASRVTTPGLARATSVLRKISPAEVAYQLIQMVCLPDQGIFKAGVFTSLNDRDDVTRKVISGGAPATQSFSTGGTID